MLKEGCWWPSICTCRKSCNIGDEGQQGMRNPLCWLHSNASKEKQGGGRAIVLWHSSQRFESIVVLNVVYSRSKILSGESQCQPSTHAFDGVRRRPGRLSADFDERLQSLGEGSRGDLWSESYGQTTIVVGQQWRRHRRAGYDPTPPIWYHAKGSLRAASQRVLRFSVYPLCRLLCRSMGTRLLLHS
jgi:hypothetical protein